MSLSSSHEAASAVLSDEDRYFSSNPPPKCLDEHMALVNEFLDKHAKANRRVVLVTSGGTTVWHPRPSVTFQSPPPAPPFHLTQAVLGAP